MMRRFVASFLLLLSACIATPAANGANCSPCAVNAVFRPKLYVSSVNFGGIPVGNDTTGDGSAAAPFLTLDKAQQAVVTGGTILANGDPNSPTTYNLTGSLVPKVYTFTSVQPYGATLAGGASTTEAFLAVLDSAPTFQDVWINPSQNTGGAAAACATIPSNAFSASRMSMTFVRVKFTGWTGNCINGGGTTRALITVTDSIFTGDQVNGAISLAGVATGSVISVSGGSCTITREKSALSGCVFLTGATGATPTVSVSNFGGTMTLDPALVDSGNYCFIRFNNIPNGTVSGGTMTIQGTPGTTTGCGVWMSHTSANTMTGSSISNVTINNFTRGGYGCKFGNEGYDAAASDATVSMTNCNVVGNATSAAGALHGQFFGYNVTASTSTGGTLTTTGIALVNKGGTGNRFTGQTISGWGNSAAIYCKGTASCQMDHITATQMAAFGSNSGILVGPDDATGGAATLSQVHDNTIVNSGGSAFIFSTLTTGSSFDTGYPANNTYTQQSGTTDANPFQMAGSNFASCPLYKAGYETTATCNGF